MKHKILLKLKKLKKLPIFLAEHLFGLFLILILFALILGGGFFYKYSILTEQELLEPIEKPLKFKTKVYKEVLQEWQDREQKFKQTDLKTFPNPF